MNLFPHQKEVLEATKGENRVAYYLDMGLGKTFVGSEKMIQLGSMTNLIVCQKSKIQDWIDHFRIHYGRTVMDLTKPRQFSDFMGAYQGGKYLLIGVINYELIWRRPEIQLLEDFTLMLDESSLIQNPKAKQTKAIMSLKAQNVILLSGTPTGGKYENLWTQVHLIGWTISDKIFASQYINWKKIEVGGFVRNVVDMDDPYKNVERLRKKMREHGAVFLKTEDVMDLPDQVFTIIKVPSTKEYKTFVKKHLVTCENVEFVGDSILNYRLCQKELCSAYNPNKVSAFRDLLQSTQDRLIVFYNFNSELAELEAACNDLGRPYSLVNGQHKDLTAYEEESNSVTLVQYKAGSMGLNLQKSNKIVYFSLTEESALFEQSKKRIHRIGQNQTCFYYLLVCENSIEDQDILPTLNIRKEFTDDLFEEVD